LNGWTNLLPTMRFHAFLKGASIDWTHAEITPGLYPQSFFGSSSPRQGMLVSPAITDLSAQRGKL
jgi:hypothetical protein